MTRLQNLITAHLEAAYPAWLSFQDIRDACLPGRDVKTVNYHLFTMRRAGVPIENNRLGGYRLGASSSVPRGLTNRTAERVLGHVSARTGVPVEGILGKRVRPDLVGARRRAARILRRLGHSLPDIGIAMQRHHTTILHHVGRASA